MDRGGFRTPVPQPTVVASGGLQEQSVGQRLNRVSRTRLFEYCDPGEEEVYRGRRHDSAQEAIEIETRIIGRVTNVSEEFATAQQQINLRSN